MAFNPAGKPLAISLNYLPRILACLVALILSCTVLIPENRIPLWAWVPIFAYGILGPHLAYVLTTDPKKEVYNITMDTFFYAYCLGVLGFQPFLMAMYLSNGYLALISYGGKRFIFYGSISIALGLLLGGWVVDFYFRQQLDLVPLLIGTVGLMVFQLNLGVVLNKIMGRLSKAKRHLKARQVELENINKMALAVSRDLDFDHVLNRIMETIETIYPFESLYVVNYIPEMNRYRIIGAYGSAVSEFELNAFKELDMDPVQDRDSIFVNGIVKNQVVVIPNLTPHMIKQASAMDQRLYYIKPSRSVAYFPISSEKNVVGGVAFINYERPFDLDDSDQKRISEYLVHVSAALRNARVYQEAKKAKEQAEHSEQAKSRFLANMSHEIRTPMTAILGYSEALLDKNIANDEREEFTQTVIRSAKHLLTIINDVLDISKIESSKMEVEAIETDLIAILSDVRAYARLHAKEKGLDYALDVAFPIPRKIICDPTRLKQIRYNLINNAIKFTEVGSITIRVLNEKHNI